MTGRESQYWCKICSTLQFWMCSGWSLPAIGIITLFPEVSSVIKLLSPIGDIMSSFIIFDDNPSGMTCPTPKLNTLFASSQNPFRLKWDSFLIPQSCLPHLKISLRWRIWESYLRSRGRDISSQDGQGGTNRNRCQMLELYLRVWIYYRKEIEEW